MSKLNRNGFDKYKKNGKYDERKIKSIGEEKVNFAWEDAMARFQKTEDDIKTIRIYSTWLLGLLTYALVALAPFAFQDYNLFPVFKEINSEEVIRAITKMLSIVGFATIIAYAKRLPKPSFEDYANDKSENIMEKEEFENELKHIKIIENEKLENRINNNKNRLKVLTADSDILKIYSIILLPYASAWGIYVAFF